MPVAEGLAAAMGNDAGEKTDYRCLGTRGAANWSRMARDAGDAQDGATCGALQWAAKHNALSEVAAFLRGLREDEWHHLGE